MEGNIICGEPGLKRRGLNQKPPPFPGKYSSYCCVQLLAVLAWLRAQAPQALVHCSTWPHSVPLLPTHIGAGPHRHNEETWFHQLVLRHSPESKDKCEKLLAFLEGMALALGALAGWVLPRVPDFAPALRHTAEGALKAGNAGECIELRERGISLGSTQRIINSCGATKLHQSHLQALHREALA